jgi:NAD(P)-dependent dehydrogenase (short-subunit alcohol dehydrogenase family)
MTEQIKIPAGWTAQNIADQSGKKFLITGATSGLGLETARVLAEKGADVTITARSAAKADVAKKYIGRDVDFITLDLASLDSVRAAADSIIASKKIFDGVILNAGVMATPYTTTVDGFELQMATNHLGHFALTGLILKQINGRLVSLASQAHRMGSFGDGTIPEIKAQCLGEGKYSPWGAYGASKLANLLFIAEVERFRLRNKLPITPVAAHPGWSATNLFKANSTKSSTLVQERAAALMTHVFAQSAAQGALPTLAAATFPGLIGNSYVGPSGVGEMRGTPRLVRARSLAYDQTLAANLWNVSVELTGVAWENSSHA